MSAKFVAVLMLCSIHSAAIAAPVQSEGDKLVGTGAVGTANQAPAIAVSGDGSTVIVGGARDDSDAGAAWVYTRGGGVSSQQGNKLVGTGAVGHASQGSSVALSLDGNTAIVGGVFDNAWAGAAWVFTRSNGVWSQQGSKLVGSGAFGNASQGCSVALSADGNTAIVGGSFDNFSKGAAWVFTRIAGQWGQQGPKLVGTGAVGNASQGVSVSLSADGNTALVGGFTDNGSTGAAWVFTRSGNVWTQQGSKLVGTGAVSNANEGRSVALSADGNTAIVGGDNDNSQVGASWVFTRNGTAWSQQGNKLVGTGAQGNASQGASVSLSGDGSTAIVGGPSDNGSAGATWVYTRRLGVWSQQGNKLVGDGAAGSASQGASVSLSVDGNTAIVGGPSDGGGAGAAWVFVSSAAVGVEPPSPPAVIDFAPVAPNPALSVATLRFSLAHSARFSLAIFNPAGRRIREVTSGVASEGEHAFTWDLRDDSGRAAGSGVYFARLEVEGRVVTRMLVALN
jgi:hypothetical protein